MGGLADKLREIKCVLSMKFTWADDEIFFLDSNECGTISVNDKILQERHFYHRNS